MHPHAAIEVVLFYRYALRYLQSGAVRTLRFYPVSFVFFMLVFQLGVQPPGPNEVPEVAVFALAPFVAVGLSYGLLVLFRMEDGPVKWALTECRIRRAQEVWAKREEEAERQLARAQERERQRKLARKRDEEAHLQAQRAAAAAQQAAFAAHLQHLVAEAHAKAAEDDRAYHEEIQRLKRMVSELERTRAAPKPRPTRRKPKS